MEFDDETASRLIKKSKRYLLWSISIFLVLGLGSYFLTRSIVSNLPNKIKTNLHSSGIELNFESAKSIKSGLGFELNKASISGVSLPVKGMLDKISLKLDFALKPKPVSIEISLEKSVFDKVVNDKKSENTASTPIKINKALGFLLKLVQLKLNIEDASAPEFGFKHLHYLVTLNRLSIDSKGVPEVTAQHSLKVEEVLDYPNFNGSTLAGTIKFHPLSIELNPQTLSSGPFQVSFNTLYTMDTQKWSFKTDINSPDLAIRPVGFNSDFLQYLKLKGGTLVLKASATGIGSDPNSIKGEAELDIKDFFSKVQHPYSDGTFKGSLKVSLKKESALEADIESDIDLSSLMFRYGNLFYKEQGVPFKISVKAKGNEEKIHILTSKVEFHSLKSSFHGELATNTKSPSSITFEISPTDLVRWERFFPKGTPIRSSGTIAARGSFSGSFDNWKMGKLNVDLKAQEVELPLLAEWTAASTTKLSGVFKLNSTTKLDIDAGIIKALATDSNINLSNANIKYSSLFTKESGTPMSLDLVVKSTNTKAEFKKAFLELGQIKLKAEGSINNFKNPVANLVFKSSPVTLGQILSFSPTIKPTNITSMNGNVTINGTVKGPLLSKTGPAVNGKIDIGKLAMVYEMPETKKTIRLNNLSGPVLFTNDSIESTKVEFELPHSQGFAKFNIRNFSSPNVQFSIDSSKFSLDDFYDMPKGTTAPPGAIPVPIAASEENDFRKNPFLQRLTLDGSIKVKSADLGYVKPENVFIKIGFDKMNLKINPMRMDVYGGSVNSDTHWNGTPKIPTTQQNIKVENVNANQFLTSYSEQTKDIVEGRLSTQMSLAFAGMTAAEIKKTIQGDGSFSLKDGKIKTLRLTKGPLESLQKIPRVGQSVTKTDWDEKLNDATGKFQLKDGQLNLSNLVLHSPYFEATASKATLDFNQNVFANILWSPNSNLVSGEGYEILKDENGKTSLPLTVSGNIKSPTVALDSNVIESRLKLYAERRIAAEKNKAIEAGKNKVQEAIKGAIPNNIGNLFK